MAWRKAGPWTLLVLALLTAPASAQAPVPGQIPGMGSMTGQIPGATSDGADQAPTIPDSETGVSWLDSALPQTDVRLLVDGLYDFRRPGRDEYRFPKSGFPGSPGWQLPESKVDWQELTSIVEVAVIPNTLSVFGVIPTRFVNPSVNPNDWGMDDIDIGVKWAFFTCPGLTTSLQLRGTIPTRSGPGLGSDHFSVEPGLLINFRPISWLCVEGELRYWQPITNDDFAGPFVRYGVGLTIGDRSYDGFWFTPVLEAVGWTILGGKETVFFPPDVGIAKNAAGEEIVNAMAGVRFGFGDNGDIYLGYGRSLTGDAWEHWMWRLEFRVRF